MRRVRIPGKACEVPRKLMIGLVTVGIFLAFSQVGARIRREVTVKPQEIKQYVGQKVRVELLPQAHQGSMVTGRLIGTLDAADGLVVHIEPEGSKPGTSPTVHYHHILSLTPEPSGS